MVRHRYPFLPLLLVALMMGVAAACARPAPTPAVPVSPAPVPTALPTPALTPTPIPAPIVMPTPTPPPIRTTPSLASPASPTLTTTPLSAPCKPIPPPTAVPTPGPDRLYKGPLFDTHLHVDIRERFGNAEALCRHLEREQTLWAIGFYTLPPEQHPIVFRAMPIIGGSRGRVIPLLQPWSPAEPIKGRFAQGQYAEAVLKGYLQPQGLLQGVGEIPLYDTDLQSITFQSPPMQAVFQVVNEMKGIVMIHPSGAPIGRPMDVAEIEPSIRKYANITFLFHGGSPAFDLVNPLMARYPNVYFSADAATWIFIGPWQPPSLMFPQGLATGSAERFVADIKRIGVERILQVSLSRSLPRLQQHLDRIMWGTDRGSAWTFEDSATELIINVSRQFIARLPAEFHEAYAFRNALRVFGRYLSPGP